MSTTWQEDRAKYASLTRSRKPDDPELMAVRSSMRMKRAVIKIEQLLAVEPPLTREQRRELAEMLLLAGGD